MPNEPQKTEGAGMFKEVHHAHVGSILGILVVVLVLILGGLYIWGAMIAKNNASAPVGRTIPNNEPETTRANADRQIMDTTSSSNDLNAIYADLESTNLDTLDNELDQVANEIQSALQ